MYFKKDISVKEIVNFFIHEIMKPVSPAPFDESYRIIKKLMDAQLVELEEEE